jgi:hypothetical protein
MFATYPRFRANQRIEIVEDSTVSVQAIAKFME